MLLLFIQNDSYFLNGVSYALEYGKHAHNCAFDNLTGEGVGGNRGAVQIYRHSIFIDLRV